MTINFILDLVAQSVRAPDCGSGGRGFDPHPSPTLKTVICIASDRFFLRSNPYRNPFFLQVMLQIRNPNLFKVENTRC